MVPVGSDFVEEDEVDEVDEEEATAAEDVVAIGLGADEVVETAALATPTDVVSDAAEVTVASVADAVSDLEADLDLDLQADLLLDAVAVPFVYKADDKLALGVIAAALALDEALEVIWAAEELATTASADEALADVGVAAAWKE